ncbi:MAG: MFS transporter [Chloroflexi bacterium]|nr:MFS transporter [Chloroflexota bacterium]
MPGQRSEAGVLPWVSPDGRLLFATVTLRSFAFGFLAILVGPYLSQRGFGAWQVGAILTAALAGRALFTTLIALFADLLGRRRCMAGLSLLSGLGGLIFPLVSPFSALVGTAALGNLNTSSKDRGPFMVLEQSTLPETAPHHRRTTLFAYYNLAATLAASLGALFSATPVLLHRTLGVETLASYKLMFGIYAGLLLLTMPLYARLSPKVEAPPQREQRFTAWPRQGRGTIFKLTALFGMDALGGGFAVESFVSYWLFTRHGVPLASLAWIFFAANILNSLSYLLAARLAGRIGLINTMVFTHLPSNLLLMAVPLVPTWWLAVLVYLAKESLSQMDVPTRQSYVVAVVPPSERTAAAGLTNLVRPVAQVASPYLAGSLVGASLAAAPFLIGGGIKVAYDILLWVTFRRIRTPEEALRGETGLRSEE